MKSKFSTLILLAVALLFSGCSNSMTTLTSPSTSAPSAPGSPPPTTATYPNTPFTQTELLAGQAFVNIGSTGSTNGTPGKFSMPTGVAIDATYAYISDTGNNTIRRVNRTTGAVETIAGSASSSGTANGNGSAARFDWPMEIYLDVSTLYISDSFNHCIRALDISSVLFPVTTVAGSCGNLGSSNGIGSAARFNEPGALVKVGGFLYVADSQNQTIRKIQLSNMQVTTVAGTAGATGSLDGLGTSARFRTPRGLVAHTDPVDGAVLFVADQGNHVIRRVVLSNDQVSTVVGSVGVIGHSAGLSATFNSPWALASDGTSLYVSDSGNNAIRKVRISDFQTSTLFGSASTTQDVFGTLAGATAYAPYGLHFDSDAGLLGLTQSAFYRIK